MGRTQGRRKALVRRYRHYGHTCCRCAVADHVAALGRMAGAGMALRRGARAVTDLAEACAALTASLPVAAALIGQPDTPPPIGPTKPGSTTPRNTQAARAIP